MTLPPARKPCVIPLFDQSADNSFVSTGMRSGVVHSAGQGRSSGRRVAASLLTAASTTAALRSLGAMVCIVAIYASSMLLSSEARAERAALNTQQATARPTNPFAAFVVEASRRFAIPEHWIRAVMRVESGGKRRARSRAGAIGLMQIMPQTWNELRTRYGLGVDPYDPHDNILAGAAYIRQLHDRYGELGFLAAYNAGPGRYENHLATGRPLPSETQTYVATLAPMIGGEQISWKIVTVSKSPTLVRSRLFVVRTANSSWDYRPSSGVRTDRPPRGRAVVDLSALVPQSGNLFVRRAGEVRSQ